MLLAPLKEFKQLLADYMYHRRANKALEVLRLHSDKQLKDIGLSRGSLQEAAHRKCPFCERFENRRGSCGDGKGL